MKEIYTQQVKEFNTQYSRITVYQLSQRKYLLIKSQVVGMFGITLSKSDPVTIIQFDPIFITGKRKALQAAKILSSNNQIPPTH